MPRDFAQSTTYTHEPDGECVYGVDCAKSSGIPAFGGGLLPLYYIRIIFLTKFWGKCTKNEQKTEEIEWRGTELSDMAPGTSILLCWIHRAAVKVQARLPSPQRRFLYFFSSVSVNKCVDITIGQLPNKSLSARCCNHRSNIAMSVNPFLHEKQCKRQLRQQATVS